MIKMKFKKSKEDKNFKDIKLTEKILSVIVELWKRMKKNHEQKLKQI